MCIRDRTNSAATLNIPNLSSVSVDDVSASSLMIEYLYAQGHRKIGLIGGKPCLLYTSRCV